MSQVSQDPVLTERQSRELEYHRTHARNFEHLIESPLDEALIHSETRRWWNHYWEMYSWFRKLDLKGKRVLVDGCGFGADALGLASLGAQVHGTDLSPESVDIARRRAERLGLTNVKFSVAACESIPFADASFDLVLLYDILHHVEIGKAISEARRVLIDGGIVIVGEPYTHGFVQKYFRNNPLTSKVLHPFMKRFIYQTDVPYITEDERKLDHVELNFLRSQIDVTRLEYFYIFLTRLVPSRFSWFARIDRLLAKYLGPLAPVVSGRFLLMGSITKK